MRDPERLLIPNGGTVVGGFTCGWCGKKNKTAVLLEPGEYINLELKCDCTPEELASVIEVKPDA